MKQLFGKREVVATGIGTALFVVLTTVEIPLGFVPKTALQPRMAVLAFIAGVFGPIAGALTGLLGHAIGDVIFYGSIWWSWVFPEAVVGLCIGLFHNKYAIKDGNFANPVSIIYFNVIQAAANAVAWIAAAPVLDILVYQEPVHVKDEGGALQEIVNILSEELGYSLNVQINQERDYDVQRFVADKSHREALLGERNFISLAEGLHRTVALYRTL